MTKAKKFVIAVAVLLAVALVSGLTTLAVTNYGTKDDPLVTLSYLNQTVTPGILDELEGSIDAKATELTREWEQRISAAGTPTASGFAVVTLSNGQTVTCGVGTEIMLRVGSAVSAGADSPRLIDETTGETVTSAGATLTANHMYMVTIQGNGVKATSNGVKILIRGDYTIR